MNVILSHIRHGLGLTVCAFYLQILISSGAHISRYLVQVAIHHFYRSAVHFIKTVWVRSMPLPVFSYFQKVAAEMFSEIPVGKNEDDGSIFSAFLKESRLPLHLRSKQWEDIRDILQKYRVRHVFLSPVTTFLIHSHSLSRSV